MSDTSLTENVIDPDIKPDDDLRGLKSAYERVKAQNRTLRETIKGLNGQVDELREQIATYAENKKLRAEVAELRAREINNEKK
jgi:septal ring factor EnvC (AmiA/AmiB activator)